MQEWLLFCLDRGPCNTSMCGCIHVKDVEERSKWDTAWACGYVGGLLKPACRAMEVLHCKRKWTVKGRTSSLNEITICPKNNNNNKKEKRGRGKLWPTKTCWGAVDGPGCSLPQGNSFMGGNMHEVVDSRNKVWIDLNSWRAKAPSGVNLCLLISDCGHLSPDMQLETEKTQIMFESSGENCTTETDEK